MRRCELLKVLGGRRDDYLTELHKIMREDDEEWLSGDDMMFL